MFYMPREVTILCLLSEIRYLKRKLANMPELQYIGNVQWVSNRPMARMATYSSEPPAPDAEL